VFTRVGAFQSPRRKKTSAVAMATPQVKRKRPQPNSPNSPGEEDTICPICLDPIIDATEHKEGQDAIFCESSCNAWLHRQCAGLSQSLYKIYQDGDDPFYCPHCRLTIQQHQLQELQSTIEALSKEVSVLKAESPQPKDATDLPSSVQEPQAEFLQPTSGASENIKSVQQSTTNVSKKTAIKVNDDRKFNVVIYGITECDKGTNRSERVSHDLHHVKSIVTEGDNSINPLSIRDSLRLGKYREQAKRPRPILVRLTRTIDVSILLLKAKSLPKEIKIKPDMTREERHAESLLLKERWSLIQSGLDRRAIKIRFNKIFVNNKLHGQVVNSSFVSHHPQAATTEMDSSDS